MLKMNSFDTWNLNEMPKLHFDEIIRLILHSEYLAIIWQEHRNSFTSIGDTFSKVLSQCLVVNARRCCVQALYCHSLPSSLILSSSEAASSSTLTSGRAWPYTSAVFGDTSLCSCVHNNVCVRIVHLCLCVWESSHANRNIIRMYFWLRCPFMSDARNVLWPPIVVTRTAFSQFSKLCGQHSATTSTSIHTIMMAWRWMLRGQSTSSIAGVRTFRHTQWSYSLWPASGILGTSISCGCELWAPMASRRVICASAARCHVSWVPKNDTALIITE